ncbi:MAG TPA: hypothetical protein VFR48_10570 [Solirubrobacteraceae bacterium]|nr:hypothetical protein [Solirubrobacteraceae bacterium]
MSQTASSLPPALADSPLASQPHLRLVGDQPAAEHCTAGEEPGRPTTDPDRREGGDHVLVAGADAAVRARMLAELRSILPQGTCFIEASETWEVVARAPGSRMVVLAGDLGEASCSSLLRLLARRNPTLPVLAVGDSERRQSLDAAHI